MILLKFENCIRNRFYGLYVRLKLRSSPLNLFDKIGIFSALLVGCGTLGLLKYSPEATEALEMINNHVHQIPLLAFKK